MVIHGSKSSFPNKTRFSPVWNDLFIENI
jgi:hypothetical protein